MKRSVTFNSNSRRRSRAFFQKLEIRLQQPEYYYRIPKPARLARPSSIKINLHSNSPIPGPATSFSVSTIATLISLSFSHCSEFLSSPTFLLSDFLTPTGRSGPDSTASSLELSSSISSFPQFLAPGESREFPSPPPVGHFESDPLPLPPPQFLMSSNCFDRIPIFPSVWES